MRIVLLLILATLLVRCSPSSEYNEYISLAKKGWNADSLAVFRVPIDDVESEYDVFLQIRNEADYRYSNLWLFIEAVAPTGDSVTDTVECILAYPDGSWIGGGFGSLYSIQFPYRLGTKFANAGTHTFRIMHGMRQEDIEGINSIGLRVVKRDGEK